MLEGRKRAPRLLSVVGTRPEAIKIAPIALAAHGRPTLDHAILATGQHDSLFDDALSSFGLSADFRLAFPPPRHLDPDAMTIALVDALAPAIAGVAPDMVLVQGDTTSALAAALAAGRLGIAVGHVEAGLRSHDLARPWPEERNRVMIDRRAALLFAPTAGAADNLFREPDVCGRVTTTGNTGIDALMMIRAGLPSVPACDDEAPALIFLTCHRRENIGAGIDGICTAALRLADRGDVHILCPVHPNPAVGRRLRAQLGNHPAISLTGALPYRDTVAAMAAARLILTDSGGIQEEAPALGVPTLVLREVTERPEGLATGNLALVGCDPDRIVEAAVALLDDPLAHAAMARPAFPFGRGDAAMKILDAIEQYFSLAAANDHPLPFLPVWTMDGAR